MHNPLSKVVFGLRQNQKCPLFHRRRQDGDIVQLHSGRKSPRPATDVEAETQHRVGQFGNLQQLRDREVELVAVGHEPGGFDNRVKTQIRVGTHKAAEAFASVFMPDNVLVWQ